MPPTEQTILPLFSLDYHYMNTLYSEWIAAQEVDGQGYNRCTEQSMVGARTDVEAVMAFLNEFRESPLTYQSYAKEVERLLLWCMHEGQIGITALRREHCLAYQEFLKAPTPPARWCGKRQRRYTSEGLVNPLWRPFAESGMGTTTIHKTITILDAFLNYLVKIHYLMGNPLALDRRRKKRHKKALHNVIDRYLEIEDIHAVLDTLDQETESDLRARYILLLLFYTGLRISEAAHHMMGDCIEREGCWFLRVLGKGQKWREIPLPDECLEVLKAFRLSLGLSPWPRFKEAVPLIPKSQGQGAMGVRRIDQILKDAFHQTADRIEQASPQRASKLRVASAHWLRHSYVTFLLKSGASVKSVQENAGHSDASTTMHYCHVIQKDRHAETKGLSLFLKE